MKLGKRGIAPVISTILLLMFASALGIIVMSWGRTATVAADKPDCSQTSLNIIEYNNKKQICYTDNKLYFTLENNGQIEISGFKVIVISMYDIKQIDLNKNMNVADIIREEIAYESTEKIQKIKFVPKIYIENKQELCPNNGLETENIAGC